MRNLKIVLILTSLAIAAVPAVSFASPDDGRGRAHMEDGDGDGDR